MLVDRLRRVRVTTFRALTADCPTPSPWSRGSSACSSCTGTSAVAFDQIDPLGELHVRWTGTDAGDLEVSDEFDEAAETSEADGTDAAAGPSEPDETDQQIDLTDPTGPTGPTAGESPA